jgi:hypothetical protein
MYTRSEFIEIDFAAAGTPTTLHFITPGRNASQATGHYVGPLPWALALVSVRVACVVAPGGALVDTFVIYSSPVGLASQTALGGATVTAAALTGSSLYDPSAIAAGLLLSCQCVIAGGSAISDVTVTARFLKTF